MDKREGVSRWLREEATIPAQLAGELPGDPNADSGLCLLDLAAGLSAVPDDVIAAVPDGAFTTHGGLTYFLDSQYASARDAVQRVRDGWRPEPAAFMAALGTRS